MLTESPSDPVTYSFSGHESFPLRYGWLPKAARAALQYEDLFSRDDALVVLGVGKNMVRSIRHWGLSTGIFERSRRGVPDSLTDLGLRLLSPDTGWDPYLEDPASLWLLHWKLTSSPSPASAWHLIFGHFRPGPSGLFSRTQVLDWLVEVAQQNEGSRATKNSIKRDVDVFLRTYLPSARKGDRVAEQSFDSPLAGLGLIDEVDTDTYTFSVTERTSLPDQLIAYALIEYWSVRAPRQTTLPFEWIVYGPGSPGAAFKLPEGQLAARLTRSLSAWGVAFDETAGMRQLIRRGTVPKPMDVLEAYFNA